MRTSLAPYLNEFVLCSGWISYWEELPELSTRQVVVSQPTIKKPDRNLLFKDQEVISTEHHLNLFIKHDDLPNYEIIFELNGIINFTGVVERYTRKDGTKDYGIYANKQSTLPYEIEKLVSGFNDTFKSFEDFEESLDYIKDYSYPKSLELLTRLKNIEDKNTNNLPTFHKTFEDYKEDLAEVFFSIQTTATSYNQIINSREYRRGKYKTKMNTKGKQKKPSFWRV